MKGPSGERHARTWVQPLSVGSLKPTQAARGSINRETNQMVKERGSTMSTTFRTLSLAAMVLSIAPIAIANDWVPADVLLTIQALSGHPAHSRDTYDRYEDALDRAAPYGNPNPSLVLQPGYSISTAKPTHAGSEFPKFRNDWVPADVIQALHASFELPVTAHQRRKDHAR